MVSLTTQRLLLRQWKPEDLPAFVAMSADPRVMAFIGNGSVRSEAEATATFRSIQEKWEGHSSGLFAVELLDTESFIGLCGLSEPAFLPEILPSVELGWRLHHAAWGHGLGTEAARAVAEWAFDSLGLERLVSVIHVDNLVSRRLAERLGMTRERRTIVPTKGVWADVYELEAVNWDRSQEH